MLRKSAAWIAVVAVGVGAWLAWQGDPRSPHETPVTKIVEANRAVGAPEPRKFETTGRTPAANATAEPIISAIPSTASGTYPAKPFFIRVDTEEGAADDAASQEALLPQAGTPARVWEAKSADAGTRVAPSETAASAATPPTDKGEGAAADEASDDPGHS